MQYKGEKNKPLPQIGRELNVDAVVEGSILRSGNRIRIAAHMVHSSTDQNLLAETYEQNLGDILKIQREIAESVAKRVRVTLTPEQQSRLHEAPKSIRKRFKPISRQRLSILADMKESKRLKLTLKEPSKRTPISLPPMSHLRSARCCLERNDGNRRLRLFLQPNRLFAKRSSWMKGIAKLL